jgi:hypothetical protein
VVLEQPQPGDFCCVPISGRVGLLIEAGQWLDGDRFQPYDHAEVYIGQPDDKAIYGYTVSTYPAGQDRQALPVPPSALPGALWSSGLIALTPAQRIGIVAWCTEHQDVRYSWADYAALALHRFGLNDPALRRYIARSDRLICSQYVDLAYSVNEVHLFTDGRWPGFVTPAMLAMLLQSKLAERLPGSAARPRPPVLASPDPQYCLAACGDARVPP